ncbi:MAG: M24 family metallopeptidase [Chromatiales bacterium]|nr:M24 family metallopeptidase [Chromatiales bacterium]
MVERREYARRRRRVMETLDDSTVVIIPTAPVLHRNRDVEYPFRPDSDFYYLTGFDEPEAVAVIAPGRSQGEYILFCRERDPIQEIWTGRCAGLDQAVARFGADDAFPIGDLDDILPGIMEGRGRVYYSMGTYPDFDHRVLSWLNSLRRRQYIGGAAGIVSLDHIIHDMRLYKSAAELRAMRHAVGASVSAHKRAMAACKPGVYEYQLEADMVHEFASFGCRTTAYPSIVAGGVNGCIMHYTDNDDALTDGDLVLIDAGAEYQYYASDVTRTFPVNGKFSDCQRAIYELVLAAQIAGIDAVCAGSDFNAPHRAAVAVIAQGLVALGLVEGPASRALETGSFQRFYMHPTGHWLGLDVHDVGDYKFEGAWRSLEPGMVTTVEPGIYIAADAPVPPCWRGIAIRIEDDVLVTRSGREVLSEGLPKQPDAVEALVGSAAHAL